MENVNKGSNQPIYRISTKSKYRNYPFRSKIGVAISTLFFLLSYFFPALSQAQTDKINLNVSNEKIEDVLLQIAAENDYEIIFTADYFSGETVSLNLKNEPIKKALLRILRKSKVEFLVANKTIVLSKKKRVYGYLSDSKTGEKLINAAIYNIATNRGGYTNEHGFFSFELPFEINKITASYIGYKNKEIEIKSNENIALNIELEPEAYLSEVVILSNQNADNYQAKFSSDTEELLTNKINSYISTGGVPDIFQYLYKKPGVAAGPDGLGGLHVRGGSSEQNLILYDGVKIHHPSHSFGLYSIFNPSLLQHAKFSKSNFSPRNGGRISSVVDLRLKEGNVKNWSGSAAISNITSEAMIEGPLVKDKTGLLLSFRRSHVDNFIKSYTRKQKDSYYEDEVEYFEESGETNLHFYDFNAKLHHRFDNNHRLFLSAYRGRDVYKDSLNSYYDNIDEELTDVYYSLKMGWGNQIYSMRWNHIWNKNLFSNATVSYSKFGAYSSYYYDY